MIHVESIEHLKALMTEVRNLRKGFITNFYLDEYKHNVWIQHQNLWFEQIDETCFFIKKSDNFWNVFYCSTTMETFKANLEELKEIYSNKTMLFDIVGRDIQCIPMIDLFQSLGFSQSISLVRMNRMTMVEESADDLSVTKATANEVRSVYDLLHLFFDEKTEQIPYLDELETYATDGHILICRDDGRIAGFLVYEINATTLYLRYWFTHPDYRDKKVGSRLMRRFFRDGKTTRRQIFWVVRTNENAIKRYSHYGFKEENMYDYIMRIN